MIWTYQPTEHVSICNLCNAPDSEFEHVADQDRSGFPATSVLCRNCGLVFLTPRMTAEGYAEFYGSGAYREIAKRFGHTTEKMELSQQKYANAVGSWLEKGLPHSIEGQSLLDIGGSNGIVAAALKERFGLARATVLEPSLKECEAAAERGLFGETGSFETWEPSGQFGIVTLWQTVDHLLDIAGSLAKVRRILAPDGLFALDIVNFSHMLKHLRVEQCIKIDHAYYLTPKTMACLLVRAGFEIVTWGSMLDGRKAFFLCRHGEPRDVLPEVDGIEKLRNLIQEVRYANHGNGRDERGSSANPDGSRPRTAAVD